MLGLALKLDAFCEDFERRQVDLLFDEIDGKVAQHYRDVVERTRNVSGQYRPWLRDGDQCDGGSWWWGPRSERMGTSANSDFHIRGVSSMARLAGCALMRWSTSTR